MGTARQCERGLECKCVGACGADSPSTCVKVGVQPPKLTPISPTPSTRKEGETCGYVFGPGYVGECGFGFECECVGPCADPQVMDAPSTCVKAGMPKTEITPV